MLRRSWLFPGKAGVYLWRVQKSVRRFLWRQCGLQLARTNSGLQLPTWHDGGSVRKLPTIHQGRSLQSKPVRNERCVHTRLRQNQSWETRLHMPCGVHGKRAFQLCQGNDKMLTISCVATYLIYHFRESAKAITSVQIIKLALIISALIPAADSVELVIY